MNELGTVAGRGFVVDIDVARNDYVVVRLLRVADMTKRLVLFVSNHEIIAYSQEEGSPLLRGTPVGAISLV